MFIKPTKPSRLSFEDWHIAWHSGAHVPSIRWYRKRPCDGETKWQHWLRPDDTKDKGGVYETSCREMYDAGHEPGLQDPNYIPYG